MKWLTLTFILVLSLVVNTTWAQNCYEIVESNSGIEDLYDSAALGETACELETLVNSSGNHGFKVIGSDFFPVLAYVNPNQGFSNVFEQTISTQDAQRQSYCLITKEHQVDGKIEYRVHIKFPDTAPFDQLTPFEREGIQSLFLQAINTEAATKDFKTYPNELAEIEGMKTLVDIFGQIIAGNFNFGGDLMLAAGFEGVDVEDTQFFERPGQAPSNNEKTFGNNTVYDYTGLKVGAAPSSLQLYCDQVSVSLSSPVEAMNDLNHAYIITDASNTLAELNAAEESFDNTDKKILIWMHFNAVDASGKIDKVFIKYGDNLTVTEAQNIVNEIFLYRMSKWMPDIDFSSGIYAFKKNKEEILQRMNCDPSWKWGKNCLLPNVEGWFPGLGFAGGVGVGLLDGLLGTVQIFYESGKGVVEVAEGFWNWIQDYTKELVEHAIAKQSLLSVFEKVYGDTKESVQAAWNEIVGIYNSLLDLVKNVSFEEFKGIIGQIWESVSTWMGGLIQGDPNVGYDIGVLLFDLIVSAFTGGGAAGAKFLPQVMAWIKKIKTGAGEMVTDMMGRVTQSAAKSAAFAKRVLVCKILGKGCFVKDTPVLMANKRHSVNFGGTAKAMAMAATIPLVALPIQEVQLLDYAVAHKTVNSSYGLTASAEESIYLGLTEKDPYTSDQQRDRDEYEINDTDWNEVVFEEVNGKSIAKLALHSDWINRKGYHVDAVVELDLPEQGVSGAFRVTSIKHILPQKKPAGEYESDDYDYRPVTALFIHVSDQVYNIDFDSGESLGVTYQHPVFSLTEGDWRLAGELEVGESVLTKSGEATVTRTQKVQGTHTVYNLEVKSLHNFLVGDEGIVVHNTCFLEAEKLMRKLTGRSYQKTPGSTQKINRVKAQQHDKIKDKYPDAKKDDNGNLLVCFDDYGFPDFGPFAEIIVEIDMNGDGADFTQAVDEAKSQIPGVKKHGTVIDEITYTWHHHQDGKSMMLIPSDINNVGRGGVAHTGGNSLVKKGLKGKDNPFASASNPRNSECN